MSVTPANPTISVGQTQQFTASGASAPTGVSAGGEYTCVRLPNGTAQCTGRNQFGQLGNGTWTDSSVLGPVSGLTTATRVAAGDEFACALLADGTAKCWGLGESGQRGDGTFGTFASTPVDGERPHRRRRPRGRVWTRVCAPRRRARCGAGARTAKGSSGTGPPPIPGTAQPVTVSGITGATAITTGAYHTCAVLGNGTLRCWGRNGQGQLGNGTFTNSSTPVPVSGLTGVAAVSGGGAHTCAVLSDGTVRCWGENEFGQLGNGTTTHVDHAGAGGRNHRRRRRQRRVAAHLRAPWRRHGPVLGSRTSSGSSATGPPRIRPRRCRSAESAAPSASLPGGGTTAARSLASGTVRCWGDERLGPVR